MTLIGNLELLQPLHMTCQEPTFRFSASLTNIGIITALLSMSLSAIPPSVEATVPGYNGRIAFQSNRDGNSEIYVMNADGSNQTNLTNHPGADEDPAWFPDGSKIAFRSDRDGNQEIYCMNADGESVTRLTNTAANNVHPAWSPDGSKIAFASDRDGNYEIYVMDADGGDVVRFTNNSVTDSFPAWSPDGSKIAYSTRPMSLDYDIALMNGDGSGSESLIATTVNEHHPAWSPDGGRILFYSNLNNNNDIYAISTDGSNQTRLTVDQGIDTAAHWSPDGSRIVFNSDRTGNFDIFVIGTGGEEVDQLTNFAGADLNPAWQPVPNQPPSAAVDTRTVPYNATGSFDVLANDTDEEALDAANMSISVQPDHGAASIVDGEIRYTPNPDYVGSDQLTYQICDSFMLDQKCATGVLGITVEAGPAPAMPTNTKVGNLQVDDNGRVDYTGHRPTFSGTSDPSASITVTINSDPIILTTTADGDGNWSVTPDQDIPDGEHTVTITATKDGSTSEPLTFVLGINTGTIPNTGANTRGLRLLGLGLLAAGGGLHFTRRRHEITGINSLPPLFP